MKYQNFLNSPCSNCTRTSCKKCEYLVNLSRDYGISNSDAKNIRDYISETEDDEEDAVNLVSKKGLRGTLSR